MVKEMRREELERKLNEGQELTKEEARELKCIIAEEEFLCESRMAITKEELVIMGNALDKDITKENAKEYLDDFTEFAYESTWINGEGNNDEEYTNELNLIVAKLKNIK